MNLQPASEAKRISMQIRDMNTEKELSIIDKAIREAWSKGEMKVTVKNAVSSHARATLIDLGYCVTDEVDRNIFYTTISWKDA